MCSLTCLCGRKNRVVVLNLQHKHSAAVCDGYVAINRNALERRSMMTEPNTVILKYLLTLHSHNSGVNLLINVSISDSQNLCQTSGH